jgi:hypothetical protein
MATFGMVIISAGVSVNIAGANNDSVVIDTVSTLPSLTANYQLKHEPSQELLARFRIMIGENGLRIDQQGEGAKGSVILNSRLDKMWLLDRRLKIFHEIPLQLKTVESSSDISTVNEENGEEGESPAEYFASFIQLEPCVGMNSERVLESEKTSSSMQVWHCSLAGEFVEKQWFDIDYGFVVKSESFDGLVATITDIREILKVSEDFVPPSNYRLVSLQEVVSISQPLNNYQETKTLSVGSETPDYSMTESTNAKTNRFTVQ